MAPTVGKLSRRKPLSSQSKEILFNLNKYFKEMNDKDMSSVTTSAQLVSTSTGIPFSTVKRVILEGKRALENGNKFRSPTRTKCRKRTVAVDDFDKAIIRRTIHNFNITDNEVPTMKRLHEKLKTDINYPGSISSLRKDVSLLGFEWKKTEDNRKILIEEHKIRYLRINFLIKIAEYRAQGRPIIYTGETYIDDQVQHTRPPLIKMEIETSIDTPYTSDTPHTSHLDEITSTSKKPISKGNGLIIVHAGGENGFVPNALLMFKANQKTGDCHPQMNIEIYTKWLKMQLIPNLKPNSVVVVGNMSYHNLLQNPTPNSNACKQDMIDWLEYRNIVHSSSMLKPQLYQLILQNKARYIEYKIDALLRRHGHTVLRLPPYHPDFNPIENIWAMIKEYVAKKNLLMNVETTIRLVKEKADMITLQEWKYVCDHASNEHKKFEGRDAAIDAVSERVILDIGNTTTDESEDQDDEDAMSGLEEILF